jgi:hypothetical protein
VLSLYEVLDESLRILIILRGRFLDILDFLLCVSHIRRDRVLRDHNRGGGAIAPRDRVTQSRCVILQSLRGSLNSSTCGLASVSRPNVDSVKDRCLMSLPS